MSPPQGRAPGAPRKGDPVREATERARQVRLMAFDVDGVLTDGVLYLGDRGEELKGFHTLDGLGMKLLQATGVAVALITARQSGLVARRAGELGIAHLFQGADDKLAVLEGLRARLGIAMAACGYMGDDFPDLPLLTRCGLAATVPEAPDAVRSRVHYVSRRPAGRGAAREVCEFILSAQGALDAAIGKHLA
jgi:3-deoxy-D-manno-octulosonate 8-phosphate phosphatase (KDO 8-P phosphatase)